MTFLIYDPLGITLRKKCPNTEFFLVRIFLYSDQKKLRIWTFLNSVKLLKRLRVDFSHLNKHNIGHNSADTVNLLGSCSLESESMAHFCYSPETILIFV